MAMISVARFLLPVGGAGAGLWLTFLGTEKLDSFLDNRKKEDGTVNCGDSDTVGSLSTRINSWFTALDTVSSLEKKIAELEAKLEAKHESMIARSDTLEKSVANSLGSLEAKHQNSSDRLSSAETNIGLLVVENHKTNSRLNVVATNAANRLSSIEGTHRNITSRLDSFEGIFRSFTKRLNSLEDGPARFAKRLNSLEEKQRDVKSGLYTLEWKYVDLVNKNKAQDSKIKEQESKIKELDTKVRFLKGREIGLNSIVHRGG